MFQMSKLESCFQTTNAPLPTPTPTHIPPPLPLSTPSFTSHPSCALRGSFEFCHSVSDFCASFMCASAAGLSSFCIVLLFMHGEGLVVRDQWGWGGGCISNGGSIRTDLGEKKASSFYSSSTIWVRQRVQTFSNVLRERRLVVLGGRGGGIKREKAKQQGGLNNSAGVYEKESAYEGYNHCFCVVVLLQLNSKADKN